MKNQKIADHYNKLYSEDPTAFSGNPLPLVEKLLEHTQKGSVLEIGAGSGRNSIFLAKNGFDVLVTDISSSAIQKIKEVAEKENISLQTEVFDITEKELSEAFDIIICTFVFQHLLKNDAESVIKKIQSHTKPSGFNIIYAFTKDGDFYQRKPDTPNFYLDNKKNLESFYSDWTIIDSSEKRRKAYALDEHGNAQFNVAAEILTQKL